MIEQQKQRNDGQSSSYQPTKTSPVKRQYRDDDIHFDFFSYWHVHTHERTLSLAVISRSPHSDTEFFGTFRIELVGSCQFDQIQEPEDR